MDAMVVGGRPTRGTSGETGEVVNPATGEVIVSLELAGREDVDRAVGAAAAAFPAVLRAARPNGNVQVAVVSPQAERHCDLSIRAIELGKHVIQDKPMSSTLPILMLPWLG